MFNFLFRRVLALPVWAHLAAALCAVVGFGWVKEKLDASYAASNHPVDYVTGQTSFSGETIKGYYAEMEAQGTLDVYWTTQLIDLGFILAMACIAVFVCTLVARCSRIASWGRRVGLLAGASVLLGAVCDAIENGWSFVMLADPTGFPDWLALPYSAFASVKFGLIGLGMGLLVVSIILCLVGRASGRPGIG